MPTPALDIILFGPAPAVLLDFVGQNYRVGGARYPTLLTTPGIAYTGAVSGTGATVRTALDSTGNLISFANDVPRITDRGLLVEVARTNSIRNSTMQGAAAGTPGTPPTNWAIQAGSGLTKSIVGTGTQAGATYVDVRIVGTTGDGNGLTVLFETTTGIPASNGQAWSLSGRFSIVAGSLANVTGAFLFLGQNTAAGAFLSSLNSSDLKASLTSSPTALSFSTTTNNASIGMVQPYIQLQTSVGAAVDLTLRVALTQAEQAASVSSFIPTASAAVTRSADAATLTYSPNGSAGTVLYGASSSAAVSPTSPINIGASSAGAWVGNYVRRLTVAP